MSGSRRNSQAKTVPLISIIIPTLNEAENLRKLVSSLSREKLPHEIIVVDGGSRDGTLRGLPKGFSTIISSAPGRGAQLRAGAARATADILLFLHADSEIPEGGLRQVVRTLNEKPEIVGGNFRLVFSGTDSFSRWLTGFYAWIRRHGVYYGDSGVFVRRKAYDAIGGVRTICMMEDFDFTRRLERHGITCCITDPALFTSSRRFKGRHPIAIVGKWIIIHTLYFLGVSPTRLAKFYYPEHKSVWKRDRIIPKV